ncbi:MAG: hypothetical protein ACD_9C00262G0002 [uncultured bacterium]|nr:MAG: hypothetical protein ACD_9C00262G0002 [uncultured bacterium]
MEGEMEKRRKLQGNQSLKKQSSKGKFTGRPRNCDEIPGGNPCSKQWSKNKEVRGSKCFGCNAR